MELQRDCADKQTHVRTRSNIMMMTSPQRKKRIPASKATQSIFTRIDAERKADFMYLVFVYVDNKLYVHITSLYYHELYRYNY